MCGALLEKTTRSKWRIWALCTLLFPLLVFYVAHPAFSSCPGATGPINQEVNMAIPPWWVAEDCQCESQACGNPSVTFRSLFKDEADGTCGQRAWAAGDGQQVISFSLFGNNSKYWNGLRNILPEVEKLYPGWKVRLYTNPRGRATVLCPLLHRHPTLLFVCDITNLPPPLGNLSSVHPMIWRMAPLGDPQVATMVVRDTDSQVSEREVAAVQEWLASGKAFHVMRDNPSHRKPILGGMWGATWGKDPTIPSSMMRTLRTQIISRAVGKRKYDQDQMILKEVLWPAMTGRVLAHDSYNCRRFNGSSPWPTQRLNKEFVGAPREGRPIHSFSQRGMDCHGTVKTACNPRIMISPPALSSFTLMLQILGAFPPPNFVTASLTSSREGWLSSKSGSASATCNPATEKVPKGIKENRV